MCGPPASAGPRRGEEILKLPETARTMSEVTTTMTRPIPTKAGGVTLPTTYVVAWLLLGAIATGYLAVLAAKPDALASLVRSSATGSDGHKFAALQRSVAALETDVGALKSSAKTFDQREKTLSERVSAIEGRIGGFASATPLPQVQGPAQTTAASSAQGAVSAGASAPATQTATAVIPPADRRGAMRIIAAVPPPAEVKSEPKVEPKRAVAVTGIPLPPSAPNVATLPTVQAASPIQTGALPEPQNAPTRMMAVRLASGPSVDALRLHWSVLTERHKASLKTLEPRYTGNDATSFQLIAGPVANAAEAQRLCQSLRSRGVSCQPAEFGGDAL